MRVRTLVALAVLLFVSAAPASAQIPQPSGPLVFCGTQAPPPAVSFRLVFDGGAPEALTMDAAMDAGCPTGSTHSFRLPASRFTVGQHTVQVLSTNTFGTTTGPLYTVTIGAAPGPFTVTAIR